MSKNFNKDTMLWDALLAHHGHNVTIACYGETLDDEPMNVSLECEDCNEVILDAEIYTLAPRSEHDEKPSFDARLANIIYSQNNANVVNNFDDAKTSNARKVIVFTGTDVYFTYKHNGKTFGELVCWVEDEFDADDSVYGTVENYINEYLAIADAELDKGIDENSIIENFTPYNS